MELASVRALKEEAKDRVRELWQQESKVRALGVRAENIGRVSRPRTMAVGVAWSAANDYKLAVRVQHPMLVGGEEVESLREMAKNEIDVRYIGSVRKLQATNFQGHVRPLRIGASVGHFRITAGSIGAFVQGGGPAMILSNNHVLANENNATAGDDILQPGQFDGGVDPADAVAKLTRFIPIDFVNPNLVDCAVAEVMSGIQIDPDNLDSLGQLAGVRTAPLNGNESVAKLGRTSNLTRGVITAAELDNVTVQYDAGDAVFDNQIEIEGSGGVAFSSGGDSGSLVVDSNLQSVGLLFAGGGTGGTNGLGFTYANPIDEVFRTLGVRLIIQ